MVVLQWIVGILKYAGLIVAFVLAGWGMTHDSTEEKNGKKVMTRSGRILFELLVAGFIISIGSNLVEDHLQDLKEKEHVQSDLDRTNQIILSGQPLTSMKFTWSFVTADSVILKTLDRGIKSEYSYHYNV